MGLFTKKKTTHDGPVRVRPAKYGGACSVVDPRTGEFTVPDSKRVYPPDHPLVVEYPWMFVTDADLLAIEKAALPNAVSLTDLGRDPLDLARAAAEAHLARTSGKTDEEIRTEELDNELAALGIRYIETEHGPAVQFTETTDPHQDETLYRRDDMEWVKMYGLDGALTLRNAGRAERAAALAKADKLTKAEREHLTYIAGAANPIDAVRPDTAPITSEQARAALGFEPEHPRRNIDVRRETPKPFTWKDIKEHNRWE